MIFSIGLYIKLTVGLTTASAEFSLVVTPATFQLCECRKDVLSTLCKAHWSLKWNVSAVTIVWLDRIADLNWPPLNGTGGNAKTVGSARFELPRFCAIEFR